MRVEGLVANQEAMASSAALSDVVCLPLLDPDLASSPSLSDTASSDRSPLSTPDLSEQEDAFTSPVFQRKKSSPRLFGDVSRSLNFEERKKIICEALRRDLSRVPDLERRLFIFLNPAKDPAVLLIQIKFFIKSHERLDAAREHFESERESLDKVVNLLESDEPDYEAFQRDLPSQPAASLLADDRISGGASDNALLTSAQEASLKAWLLQVVMQFLDRLMEFFAGLQCVPLSPFCARTFSC